MLYRLPRLRVDDAVYVDGVRNDVGGVGRMYCESSALSSPCPFDMFISLTLSCCCCCCTRDGVDDDVVDAAMIQFSFSMASSSNFLLEAVSLIDCFDSLTASLMSPFIDLFSSNSLPNSFLNPSTVSLASTRGVD